MSRKLLKLNNPKKWKKLAQIWWIKHKVLAVRRRKAQMVQIRNLIKAPTYL